MRRTTIPRRWRALHDYHAKTQPIIELFERKENIREIDAKRAIPAVRADPPHSDCHGRCPGVHYAIRLVRTLRQ